MPWPFTATQHHMCYVAISACAGAALIAAVVILAIYVYNTTLHPLAAIPGPRLAALSNIWLAHRAKNGELAQLGRTLHGHYGPAVRVGPDQVWFNSKTAFKAIYSNGSGYGKSNFYLATMLVRPRIDWFLHVHPVDTLDLLSETDVQRYRLQRRLIGPVYRASNVAKYEKEVDKVIDGAIEKLRSLQGAEIDLKEWMHIIAVECLGAHSYRAWRRKTVMGLFPTAAKLEMCSKSFGRAFSVIWGVAFRPPPNFRPFFPTIGRRIGRRIKAMDEEKKKKKQTHNDLAADLIRLHQDKDAFTEQYLRKMIMTNFGAGHETMASTLTSIMAMIGTHAETRRKIRDERPTVGGDMTPYLSAVIKETKRLHPVIATALPREVPPTGLHLHGHFIPPGATVGCNPVALHRNEDICGPDPDLFTPERWLTSPDRARDMDVFSLSWGGGARSCPGRHLAEMVVHRVVTRLVGEFDVQADVPDAKDMPAYFLSIMTGVTARFLPINQEP